MGSAPSTSQGASSVVWLRLTFPPSPSRSLGLSFHWADMTLGATEAVSLFEREASRGSVWSGTVVEFAVEGRVVSSVPASEKVWLGLLAVVVVVSVARDAVDDMRSGTVGRWDEAILLGWRACCAAEFGGASSIAKSSVWPLSLRSVDWNVSSSSASSIVGSRCPSEDVDRFLRGRLKFVGVLPPAPDLGAWGLDSSLDVSLFQKVLFSSTATVWSPIWI